MSSLSSYQYILKSPFCSIYFSHFSSPIFMISFLWSGHATFRVHVLKYLGMTLTKRSFLIRWYTFSSITSGHSQEGWAPPMDDMVVAAAEEPGEVLCQLHGAHSPCGLLPWRSLCKGALVHQATEWVASTSGQFGIIWEKWRRMCSTFHNSLFLLRFKNPAKMVEPLEVPVKWAFLF